MYELHIGNKNYSSWSLRPWVLMQALGIRFNEQQHVFATANNYETFRAFSPNGRVPCLQDGEITVWDSLAIVEYLAERYENVWPSDAAARAWARCASAEMHSGFPALRNVCSMNCGTRVRLHDLTTALQAEVNRLDELWSQGLERFSGPFLAGNAFTAADAFYAPMCFRVQTYGLPLNAAAMTWVSRMLVQPAMRWWYDAAVNETWRDVSHEDELRQAGVVTLDLRKT
jgi:glutathione S-transferase